jgi:hypothetical protein
VESGAVIKRQVESNTPRATGPRRDDTQAISRAIAALDAGLWDKLGKRGVRQAVKSSPENHQARLADLYRRTN